MMGNGYSDILASVSGKTPYIQDNTKDFECFYNPFNLSDYIYTYTLLGSGNGEAKKAFLVEQDLLTYWPQTYPDEEETF